MIYRDTHDEDSRLVACEVDFDEHTGTVQYRVLALKINVNMYR